MIANIPYFSILTILLQVSLNLQSVNGNVIPVGYSLSDAEAPAATTSNLSGGNYPSYTENTIGAPRPTVPTNRWNPQSSVHPSDPPQGTIYPSNPQNPVYPSNPQNPPNAQNSGPPQVIPHPAPHNPNYPSNPNQDECSEDDDQPAATSQLPSALYPLPNEPVRTVEPASTVTQFSSPPVSIITIQSSTTITNSNGAGATGGSGGGQESVSTVFSTTTDSADSSHTSTGTQSDSTYTASATSSQGSEATTNASSHRSSEITGSQSNTSSGSETSSGTSSGAEQTDSATSSGGTFTEAATTASSTTSGETAEPTNGYKMHLAQYMYVRSVDDPAGKEQWSGWGPRVWTFHFNDSYRSEVFDMYKYEAKTGDGGKMETGTCQETLRCTASVTESPGAIYSVTVEPGFPATSTITGSAFLGCSSPTPAPPQK